MYSWFKVAAFTAEELKERELKEVEVEGKNIGLVKLDSQIHGFAAICPHAGARLCQGWLDAQGRIVCPKDSYRFDPKNGRNTSGEGYKLRTYPVEIRDGSIYIGLIG